MAKQWGQKLEYGIKQEGKKQIERGKTAAVPSVWAKEGANGCWMRNGQRRVSLFQKGPETDWKTFSRLWLALHSAEHIAKTVPLGMAHTGGGVQEWQRDTADYSVQ
ncbi:uncharacterized protein SPSK_04706 [Sporothrix schenckii 1099-18]|uniref:Uncharacterized protein n=1 Tax=Sporothrix schenckii 1099-18 TaxID=1397361 RepID=A0A0F2LZF9_SPOSC|nr:uncharacterized protein SPSK_04706 [Sporothrix schenckii 1099-18]KJR82843.1 hypothetical protein SPSK_04706 [Sporothrix schenckii 1099-18]